MVQEQIYHAALGNLRTRRMAAQQQQEQRTDQIHREIPETAELDRQLRTVCMSLLQAMGKENSAARIEAIARHSAEADAMLRQLLTANGYPADYLDLHYTCSQCNDTGFVAGKPCKCLTAEIGRVSAEQFNANSQLALCSFQTFSLHYYSDLPPEQYQLMEKNLLKCKQYAADFSPERAGNLLLVGNTGLGKTHLSLAIANELLQKGFSVMYDAAGSLLHTLEHEQFRRGGEQNETDTLSAVLSCDLLILDDFGTEFDTSFSRSMIYTLLNGRISARKPIIINTNLNHQEIKERYGDRILSRLLFASDILHLYGKDIRIQKRSVR